MKKFRFRMQVVLNMREKELEERQMEMAKILAALNSQQAKLKQILDYQEEIKQKLETLCSMEYLDVQQIESHKNFGNKLLDDARNQERIIANTQAILKAKQKEVKEAHHNVEILKKLKEKQEKEYYKEFLTSEMKEIDDITSARYRLN